MLLTVLGEIVGQCLFTEIIQVTVQIGEHTPVAIRRVQSAARQRANELLGAEMQAGKTDVQNLQLVSDGSVQHSGSASSPT
jgi:hypothetical protein